MRLIANLMLQLEGVAHTEGEKVIVEMTNQLILLLKENCKVRVDVIAGTTTEVDEEVIVRFLILIVVEEVVDALFDARMEHADTDEGINLIYTRNAREEIMDVEVDLIHLIIVIGEVERSGGSHLKLLADADGEACANACLATEVEFGIYGFELKLLCRQWQCHEGEEEKEETMHII